MGRFFKTSSPQQLDYMYKLPEELMLKATAQASQDITENQVAMYSLMDKLRLPAITQDKDRAKEIVSGYENKINTMAEELQRDPLAFRKRTGDIISLSREIGKDWTQGEAAAIASRYAGYQSLTESLRKQVESGKIKNPNDVPALLSWTLSKQKPLEWNPTTGNYNQWQDQYLIPDVDIQKKYVDFAKEMKPHVKAYSGVNPDYQGKYVYENKGKIEYLSEEQLSEMLYQMFLSDDDTQAFLRQRGEIGTMSGFTYTDENGQTQIINPYGKIGETKDKSGKVIPQYGWKTDTKLGMMFSGITDMFKRNEVIESSQSISSNPYAFKLWGDAIDLAKETPADTFNTPFKVDALYDRVQYFHNGRAMINNTVHGLAYHIKQGLASGNFTSQQQAAIIGQVTAAQEKAYNGDISDLAILFGQYAPQESKTSDNLNTIAGYNKAYPRQVNLDRQYEAMEALVLKKHPDYYKTNSRGQKVVDSDKVDAVIQTWLDSGKYNTRNIDLWSTSGNTEDLFPTPELKQAAIKTIKPIVQVATNPANWGGSFIYVSPTGKTDKYGKMETNAIEATLASLGTDGKLSFNTPAGKTSSVTLELNEGTMENATANIITKGGVTNKFGTAQIVPYSMSFPVTTLNGGVKHQKKDWMIKIPVIASDGNRQGYILLDGNSIKSDQWQALRDYAEEAKDQLSTVSSGKLGWEAIADIYKDQGEKFDVGAKDIYIGNNTNYNVGSGLTFSR